MQGEPIKGCEFPTSEVLWFEMCMIVLMCILLFLFSNRCCLELSDYAVDRSNFKFPIDISEVCLDE